MSLRPVEREFFSLLKQWGYPDDQSKRQLVVVSSVLLSLSLILAACHFMPSPTSNQRPLGADVVPAFNTKAEGSGQPEMLTFPSQVTTQKLTAVEQLAQGKHFALRFNTKPIKNLNKPAHIQIPENGPFQLTIQPGNKFAITDADGTDGSATVMMPQDVYNAYVKLEGKRSKEQVRSLKVQDDLYYVKDELIRTDQGAGSFTVQANKDPKPAKLQIAAMCSNSPNDYRVWKITNPNATDVEYSWEVAKTDQADDGVIAPPGVSYLETESDGGNDTLKVFVDDKVQDSQVSKPDVCLPGQEEDRVESTWWSLRARSLPVPMDWHSDNGANQVFKLSNQGASNFVMRWVKTPGQQVSFPPGIKEIGIDGGTIELPGIAKLEIPANAISQKTVIRLSQALSARSLETQCPYAEMPDKCYPGRIYVSPIVQLQPLGLELKKTAIMNLNLFKEAYYHPPYRIGALGNNDLSTDFWGYDPYFDVNPNIKSIRDMQYGSPILVKIFSYISKQALGSRKLPGEEAFRLSYENSFKTQYCFSTLF